MSHYSFTKSIKINAVENANFDCLILSINKEQLNHFLKDGSLKSKGLLSDLDLDFIEKIVKSRDFVANCGQNILISGLPKSNIPHILLHGLGDTKICAENKCQKLSYYENKGGSICNFLVANEIKSIGIYSDNITDVNEDLSDEISIAIASGIVQKLYRFSRYITTEKRISKLPKLSSVSILYNKNITDKLSHTNATLESIYIARDLVNEPANTIYPEKYAFIIKEAMNEFDNISVDILDLKDLQKLGMGSLIGVSQGSDKEPRVVVVKYNGHSKQDSIDIALVGKGVTFDSGGLSIKPADSMEDMKDDMAGSALAFSSLRLLAKRKAKVNAICVVGLVENMINGNAQRPGDIVKSMSGQTIEVLNTDAEGRLVLADVLYYTKTKYNPEIIIDFATLTGAMVVALGFEYAGFFSNSKELVKEIYEAGMQSGEKCWNLPLDSAYDKLMDSKIADVKNISGSRGAGSITAAQFLQRFIDGHTEWAHIDIAGVGGLFSSEISLSCNGASGFGVKLIDTYIRNNIEKI